MTLHIGLDLGTSGVKAVLLRDLTTVVAEAAHPLSISRPQLGWSEQDPDDWVAAVLACLDDLAAKAPDDVAQVRGIGLSGQMLAALILDGDLRPIRPAMLWNDQRAQAECATLLARMPDIGQRSNGTPDPGITAAKLLWLASHEPRAMDRARMLLLTKDYVRLVLTAEIATEASDAGGTQLLDCRLGVWDEGMCVAAGWDIAHLPPLVDSWAAAGQLRAKFLARWGMVGPVVVAAGAGDNMGSTLGAGGTRPGNAVLTLGTSGVSCIVDAEFHPGPDRAILTSAHVVASAFLSMGVVMSATASLDWVAGMTGQDPSALNAAAEAFVADNQIARAPHFLPCLTGVRTPLNRPDLLGRMSGLHPGVTPGALAYATMEGVAFQLADCLAAQAAVGVAARSVTLVGGGSRSRLWSRLIATALQMPVNLAARSDIAGPLGAARLAAVAAGAGTGILEFSVADMDRIDPDAALHSALQDRRAGFDALSKG